MTTQRSLRLWPGVVLAGVLVLARYVLPPVAGDAELFGFPLVIVGISRRRGERRCDRRLVAVLQPRAMAGTRRRAHPDGGGVLRAALRGGRVGQPRDDGQHAAACTRSRRSASRSWRGRRSRKTFRSGARGAALVAAIVLACLPWTLVRSAGIRGIGAELHLRWTPTPEERLLATENAVPRTAAPPSATASTPAESAAATPPADKPAPLGGSRTDSRRARTGGARGQKAAGGVARIPRSAVATAWCAASASTPIGRRRLPSSIWRRAIGPGWSSFAVDGDLVYTQEQRGDDEVVSCYRFKTGEPVWQHGDAIRFWEAEGGAGPRATPTVDNGRVYAMGATGLVNALDAATGARDLVAQRRDRDRQKIPGLGRRQLAGRDRRPRGRQRRGAARRLRCRDGSAALARADRRRRLQLAASGDDRWRSADRVAQRRPARSASTRPMASCSGSSRPASRR